MRKGTRGQLALIPVTTRAIPAWRLLDGDSARRSAEVRRARGALTNPEWHGTHVRQVEQQRNQQEQ